MNQSMQSLATDVGFDLPTDWNASRLLWDNLQDNGDRPAIYFEEAVWSYRQLADEAGRVGSHLIALGCHPGDRVVMIHDDTPSYPAAIMGALRAGLIPVLINTLSTKEMVEFYLTDSEATAVIVSASFTALLPDNLQESTRCSHALISDERPWSEANAELAEHPVSRSDMSFWMYSSGSTGLPKGVVHTHEDAAYVGDTFGSNILQITQDDICFSVPKIYFAYGFGNSILFPMRVGAAALLMSGRPTPERVLAAVEKHSPTLLFALPTVYTALVDSPDFKQAQMASVRLFLSAAEVLSEELAGVWQQKFSKPIIEGLGSTEMTHIYLSNSADKQKSGSAGKVVPGYAVRLVNSEGAITGEDEEGVMEVLGLSRTSEYWNRPEKTAESMRGEWLNTGDRFKTDADGFYYFLGRADDLVKVSGQWVYPMEIELSLNEHAKVFESCVAAIEMADKRMTIHAWVSLKEGIDSCAELEKELKTWVKTRLLPHKYPREIWFMDNLPKTGTDKIDRQALKNMLNS